MEAGGRAGTKKGGGHRWRIRHSLAISATHSTHRTAHRERGACGTWEQHARAMLLLLFQFAA